MRAAGAKNASTTRRWARRLSTAVVAAPGIVALVGFLILPPVVKRVAESQLGELLGRRVAIERVRVNPFSLSLTIENFQVFETDRTTPFVAFARLYVNAQLSSVYRRAPIVREVRLDSPHLHVVRLKSTPDAWGDATAYNFSDILARLAARSRDADPPPPSPPGPARFSINNIRITGGEVVFEDRPLGSVHRISSLELGIPFVSTLPTFLDTFVEPGLRLTIDGTPFAVGGRTKPFTDSLETTIELRAKDFDLTKYLSYVPMSLRFDMPSALLDVKLDVAFVRPTTGVPRLTVRGRVALKKVVLREKSGAPLVSLVELAISIDRADVMAQVFKIDRVAIAGLDVHVTRLTSGTLNLERLSPSAPPVANAAATPPNGPAPAKAIAAPHAVPPSHASASARSRTGAEPRFEIDEISLTDGVIHARDETVHPAFEALVDRLAISVRGLSNAPGTRARVVSSLRANPGGAINQEGTLGLEPLASAAGTITVDGLEPSRFASYYRDLVAFDVRQGRVKFGAGYQFGARDHGREPDLRVKNAFVELADVALRRRGASDDFFGVRELSVRAVDVDPGQRTATVGEIATRGGRVRAQRDRDGVVDWTTLLSPAKTEAPPPLVPPAVPISRRATTPNGTDAIPAGASTPWTVSLRSFDMNGWSARLDDRKVLPPAVVTVSPIAIKASGFGTAPGTRGNLDIRLGINNGGHLSVSGSASVDPVAADVRIDLRALEILPLQPYFADQVNLVVTDGALSVKGQAKVVIPPAPSAKAAVPASASEPRVTFAGDVDVTRLASVDGTKHEELLKWKSLHIGQLALATATPSLAIGQVALTDFYARLAIFPDAHLNVEDLLRTPAARPRSTAGASGARPAKLSTKSSPPSPTPRTPEQPGATATPRPSAATPPTRITVGQITLQGGHVSFNDQLIRPHYSAELTELAGRISGLSADIDTQADVDIRGSVDHSGELSIVGKANPLAKNLFVDVKVDLKDFELPPASPYAAKYAGYGIEKGKLALALDYHIADRKLDAKNRLIVDQLTFGDRVPGPDATSLPVRLAVALLKDRHGVIDIDLPIAGSLEDPDFKIGRALLKVLGNLIVKAATAPFSMIASLFGGDDQLSRVDFPQGLATLDGKALSRLGALGRALRERPGLSFEIEGAADRNRDGENLKRHLYEGKLRAQKMLELVTAGAAVSDPETVRFDPAERERLVGSAYKTETFPKPRNILGRAKELPVVEMEKLMLTNTIVDDDALRMLAKQRATNVRAALAKGSPDVSGRLFLVTPRLFGGAGSSPTVEAGNRVEFRLKKD